MELRQLRYFVTAAELGSISKAAEMCRVAQPSISQQLGMLEADLGVRLLQRSSRGVKLTADGELWLTDSGPGGGAGTSGAQGRILMATMPVLAPTGATGAVPDDQVFVDVPVTLVRRDLRNPFEGWLWRPTFPISRP